MPAEASGYYLALLQLYLALIGLVIGGVLALVQMLNNAKPQRSIRLLVHPAVLVAYGVLLTALLLLLSFGSWVAAFPESAGHVFGAQTVAFIGNGLVTALAIVLSLVSLTGFAYLIFKTRVLLDTQRYLHKYGAATSAAQVRAYLASIYSDSPRPGAIFDPFQPIREYIKDNAFQYYDYGTADGLKHMGRLFDKTLAAIQQNPAKDELYWLARYLSGSMAEFFAVFKKTSSEKREVDTIKMVTQKGIALLEAGNGEGLTTIVRCLEHIATLSDEDDDIIMVLECIQELCDAYLRVHQDDSWEHVSVVFDDICLSVTRIAETYYLHKNHTFKTVPVIGYHTGEHKSVTDALVGFFMAYKDLGDRYTATTPVRYLEAIEGVVEVLFTQLADNLAAGRENIGFNMSYHDLARDLYAIYHTIGLDAIEHRQLDLLALSLGNLRRIIKPAKNFKLAKEQAAATNMLLDVAVQGIATFGDVPIKGDRTISAYTYETLQKHADLTKLSSQIKSVTHQRSGTHNQAILDLLQRLEALTPDQKAT